MAARKGGLIAAASTTYLVSAYCVYSYYKQPSEEDATTKSNQFSYVRNPNRAQTFQEIASSYDNKISRDETILGMPLLRRWLLHTHAKGNVLEVGAGTCRNIPYYPQNDINKIVLTDNSEKMLLEAFKKIPDEQRKMYSIVKANASNLTSKFANDTFDTVVDTFGLCSFDDPVNALNEMARVCKGNGKILLLEHGKSESTYSFMGKILDDNAEKHAKHWVSSNVVFKLIFWTNISCF